MPSSDSYENKYCLIGAGATGLAAARAFRDAGLQFDCLERDPDVGGVWRFGGRSGAVNDSTHLITSIHQTEFADFPMPASFPPYPSHRQVLAYLQDFARHFDLYRWIEFNTAVERMEPAGDFWNVTLSTGETRRYRGVVVANGHLREPKRASYPGEFAGRIVHSREVGYSSELHDQRVLVVGMGNSGCDMAVEAGRFAAKAFHSVRRGRHFVPKFLFGQPTDSGSDWMWRWNMPLWVHRLAAWWPLHIAGIDPTTLGLPKPDHPQFAERVIPNDRYLSELAHGRFQIKPDIARFDGQHVEFVDGTREEIDLVILATGYQMYFPFLDSQHLDLRDGIPWLALNAFHPRFDNLFFVGFSEPSTKTWDVAGMVARSIALVAQRTGTDPEQGRRFREWKQRNAGPVGHGSTPLMRFHEVEYHQYLQRLRQVFRQFHQDLTW